MQLPVCAHAMQIEGFSTERSFLVPAKPGPSMPVRILAVADMGQAEADGSIASSSMIPSLNTTRMMAEEVAQGEGGDKPYSLLLHTGDISYAR